MDGAHKALAAAAGGVGAAAIGVLAQATAGGGAEPPGLETLLALVGVITAPACGVLLAACRQLYRDNQGWARRYEKLLRETLTAIAVTPGPKGEDDGEDA